jgi:hypothetical protein
VPRKASKGVFTLGVRVFSVHDFLSKLDDVHMVWNILVRSYCIRAFPNHTQYLNLQH